VEVVEQFSQLPSKTATLVHGKYYYVLIHNGLVQKLRNKANPAAANGDITDLG
jgi:hypothetical protein